MRSTLILATMAVLSLAAPAMAVTKTAPKKPAATATRSGPTDAQLKQARDTLSLFVSAFNSSEVPQPTKEKLFECLYSNPLGKISRGRVEAAKVSKASTPTQQLMVLAGLCNAPWPVTGADKPAGR